MTPLLGLVRTPLAKAIGWTLVHSLWEGALVAAVLVTLLCVVRSSNLRYVLACAAMLALLAGFAFTAWQMFPGSPGTEPVFNQPFRGAPAIEGQGSSRESGSFHPRDLLPWLTPFWIAGVALFQIRSLTGWVAAQRLRGRGVCAAPDPWNQRLAHLRERMRIHKPVALLETAFAGVPVVIGHARPLILVPIGMLAGMPAAQVEAILMHELAHIRRRDYLANLLQNAAEGFLFYHPAVWWISGVIRAERENCCDDLVVAGTGNAHEYAAALTSLERNRARHGEALLAASGGNLVKRVHRLLYPRESSRGTLMPLLSAAILTVTAALTLTAWQSKPEDSGARQDSHGAARLENDAAALWWQKWLNEDAFYIIRDEERIAFISLRTDEERKRFIEQFWLRRDPTPGTPENEYKDEHYRRIAFANAHFRSGIPGWKTDRGRVYIEFGPPDEIESHPSGEKETHPFEQWLYHHVEGLGDHILVEFVDTKGTGDYRLTEDPRTKDKRP